MREERLEHVARRAAKAAKESGESAGDRFWGSGAPRGCALHKEAGHHLDRPAACGSGSGQGQRSAKVEVPLYQLSSLRAHRRHTARAAAIERLRGWSRRHTDCHHGPREHTCQTRRRMPVIKRANNFPRLTRAYPYAKNLAASRIISAFGFALPIGIA